MVYTGVGPIVSDPLRCILVDNDGHVTLSDKDIERIAERVAALLRQQMYNSFFR